MRQTLLTISLIAVLIAAGFAWFRYMGTAPPAEPARAQEALSERLNQYRRLKSLSPDTGIFSEPLFMGLKPAAGGTGSSSQPIQAGRNNPFAF